MMKKSNIFLNISSDLQDEIFEDLVKKESFKLQRIISQGHTTPKDEWYDQDEDEWVMLVSGEAVLSFFDDEDVHLKAGDYINIRAHKRHRVSWTKPDVETIWLALHSQSSE
ncbi:MAG: cupin domain-containing protein [Sulfurimonas sp.]|uniref:cupin domain-containing protein n=1 Tax=Sulfurimonas sp. TaxID=2022749 RepID=UPI0025FA2EC5|nr:cupin domain-containing protein [Sulfurimonas sp.]MCK9490572.1 cupin domain-containing protein [Sulfurimonas sp.]